MSAECKHGRYFPDGDECCGLCAGEEINTLKARIAELDLVVANAATYCAYCGGSMALNDLKAMAEHVARCPNHPSHALQAEVVTLKARVAELETPRFFPIQDGPAIPWAVIAPHERQAKLNHNQSLKVLAFRGGLCPEEAVAVLEDRPYARMDSAEALAILKELIGWLSPEEAHRLRYRLFDVESYVVVADAATDGAQSEIAALKKGILALKAGLGRRTP